MGMPSAVGESALLPHLFLRGKLPDGAAPPSPTHRLHKATAQARGSPGAKRVMSGAGTLGRGSDARARGHPQHLTAAACRSTQGRRTAPSGLPAPRSAAAPARLPSDRHCQVQPRPRGRPSRQPIGCGKWLAPPLGAGPLQGRAGGWGSKLGEASCGHQSFCFANPEIDSSKERRERKRLLLGEGRGSAGPVP